MRVYTKRVSTNTQVAMKSKCARYSSSFISLSNIDGKIKTARTPMAKYSEAKILSSEVLRRKSYMKEEKISPNKL